MCRQIFINLSEGYTVGQETTDQILGNLDSEFCFLSF